MCVAYVALRTHTHRGLEAKNRRNVKTCSSRHRIQSTRRRWGRARLEATGANAYRSCLEKYLEPKMTSAHSFFLLFTPYNFGAELCQ